MIRRKYGRAGPYLSELWRVSAVSLYNTASRLCRKKGSKVMKSPIASSRRYGRRVSVHIHPWFRSIPRHIYAWPKNWGTGNRTTYCGQLSELYCPTTKRPKPMQRSEITIPFKSCIINIPKTQMTIVERNAHCHIATLLIPHWQAWPCRANYAPLGLLFPTSGHHWYLSF